MRTCVITALPFLLLIVAEAAGQESLPAGGQPAGAAAPTGQPSTVGYHSYAIGYDLGMSMRSDEIELDLNELIAGLRDAMQGRQPKHPQEALAAAMEKLNEQRMAKLEQFRRANLEFLQKNLSQQGVQVTKSGLQYAVVKSGDGPTPGPRDVVFANYRGQMIDGKVFDASNPGTPAEFPVDQVIPGWTEALQMMKVGDRWRLFVPASLAYGESGWGNDIPPHATLIFDLELAGIAAKQPAGR